MEKPRRTQLLDKLTAEVRRTSPRRRLLMVVVVIAATAYLMTLKQGVQGERATVEQAKAAAVQQRAATNEEINAAMTQHLGGPSKNVEQKALLTRVTAAVVGKTQAAKFKQPLRVILLAEPDHINLYALSSGEVYLTTALLNRMQTEGQLASMVAHGVAHVLAGDGLSEFPEGTSKRPKPLWQYRPESEQKADALTVALMGQAGYDPHAFGGALAVLAQAYHAGADAAFFNTHPSAADRQAAIDAAIKLAYPEGIPAILSK